MHRNVYFLLGTESATVTSTPTSSAVTQIGLPKASGVGIGGTDCKKNI